MNSLTEMCVEYEFVCFIGSHTACFSQQEPNSGTNQRNSMKQIAFVEQQIEFHCRIVGAQRNWKSRACVEKS